MGLKEIFEEKLEQYLIWKNKEPKDCVELMTEENLWGWITKNFVPVERIVKPANDEEILKLKAEKKVCEMKAEYAESFDGVGLAQFIYYNRKRAEDLEEKINRLSV